MSETVLNPTTSFLLLRQEFTDSWEPMRQTFDYAKADYQKPLYAEIFFTKKPKFQYSPTSLLIFYPLTSIDNFLNYIGISWIGVLQCFSWLSVGLLIYFVIQVFKLSLTRNVEHLNYLLKFELFTINTLLLCLVFTFYPVIKAYTLGQIQAWINSLFAIFFWCWMKKRKGISGVIVGAMCLMKPQYSIILLWGLLRKQWTFTLAFATTTLTGILVAILLFGIGDNISYLNVLSFISKHGEAFYANQSINGLLNRLLFNGDNLNFDPHSFPPFNPWVYFGTIISSIALISAALLQPKQNQKGSITDLSIVALTCTIASPIAWEHHYGILLPPICFFTSLSIKEKKSWQENASLFKHKLSIT
jgi:hypothetical protein